MASAEYKSNIDQGGVGNGSHRSSVHLTNANNNSTFGSYAPVKSIHSQSNGKVAANGKAVIQMPYYDNDSSTEDEALFRKPYTDEVKWSLILETQRFVKSINTYFSKVLHSGLKIADWTIFMWSENLFRKVVIVPAVPEKSQVIRLRYILDRITNVVNEVLVLLKCNLHF